MKKLLIAPAVSIFIIYSVSAQVSGISASKLATYNASVVGHKTIEFEPAFGSLFSTKFFNENGGVEEKFENSDSISNESELGFRMTYGVVEGLEIGVYVPTGAESFSLGAKYNFLSKNKYGIAAILGYNMVLNNTRSKENVLYEESDLLAGGLAATLRFSEKFSIDIDGQCQLSTVNTSKDHEIDLFFDLDIGYYIVPWLQPVLGTNFGHGSFNMLDPLTNENMDVGSFDLNFGMTIEPAEQFLIVLNSPLTLAGKNTDKTYGFGFALTVTLE